AYGFTSLGPRVGAGNEHIGSIEITVRPLPGASHRDLLVSGVIRAALGSAPVAANPPLNTGSSPPPPVMGRVTTTTIAAAGRVEAPLRRGLVAFGGVDLALSGGTFDPAPRSGQAAERLVSVVTFGIAATFSTDPRETVRRDPEEEDDAARRREGA